MAKLTAKQRAFIDFYFLTGMNATQAAIKAGYSEDSAAVIGHENLRKPNIKEEIERIYRENTMPPDEVLARLTAQARGDIGDLVNDNGAIDMKKARRFGLTGLIKKIKRTTMTYTDEAGNGKESFTDEIELYSSQAALQLIGKYHKLFVDRQEVTGKDGGAIIIKTGMSMDDL
jgi:phage terminase small subunit